MRSPAVKPVARVRGRGEDDGMLSIGTTVLTVEDIGRAGDFWRAALGYRNRGEPSEDWLILDQPDKEHWHERGASLAPSVTGYAQHYPPRIHLDLYADDQAAEVTRLRSLGASPVDIGQGKQTWIVLADPDGNEFCVLSPRD